VGGQIVHNRGLSFSYVGQRSREWCKDLRFAGPAFRGGVSSGQGVVGTLFHSSLALRFGEDFRCTQYQCWVLRSKECGLGFSSRTSTIVDQNRRDNLEEVRESLS
jgi:hypothetical protein